ncbi:DUF4149 domain-containing protein [Spirillospora sp. CA-255316]
MDALATGTLFTWFGMIVAISFIEAPLKFRAPGITRELGLGIGRLVFRALNTAEIVLAAVTIMALALDGKVGPAWVPALVAAACLLVQVVALRPPLDRRAATIVEGGEVAPSRLHLGYIVLEGVKAVALPIAGALVATA